MILTAKKKYEQHPETDGPIRAVIVDVTDPIEKDNKYQPGKKVLKIAIVYETELKREDGTPWTHWVHNYTASMDEKATLRKDVGKILGTVPDPFDTEMLIGKPVKIIVEHKTTDDETYANITYLKQDTAPDALKPSGTYIRQRDKKKDDATNTGSSFNKAEGTAEQKQGWQQTKVHVGKFAGQELENLDEAALKALIEHWIPSTQAAGYKVTADDKRLLAALEEVQKLLASAGGVPVEAKF